MIELRTTTYGCTCGYKVDAEAFQNVEYFSQAFDVPYGTCPSCKSEQLASILDFSQLSTHLVSEDADLEAEQKDVTDAQGAIVMEESDRVEQVLAVVDGKADVIEKPIMQPAKRDLTKQELADLKLQRDNDLDKLEAIAVQEVQ